MFSKSFFRIFFAFVVLVMIGGFVWNFAMFQDCRNHGHAAYQCAAIVGGDQHYVAVDNFDE